MFEHIFQGRQGWEFAKIIKKDDLFPPKLKNKYIIYILVKIGYMEFPQVVGRNNGQNILKT